MTEAADTLRGDGLAMVDRALDRLQADPMGLDRARTRFGQSPALYISTPSHETTRPESPSDGQRLRDQMFNRRLDERKESLPLQQFLAQRTEESLRIWKTSPHTSWIVCNNVPSGCIQEREATEIIKKRWVEQGIWKDKWDDMAAGYYMDVGLWKHEEPLGLESDTEVESPPQTISLFGVPQKQPQPKPKSNDEKKWVAEQRAVQEREREASRPYHQFVYQISKECERIQDNSADINTRAYENVRNTWIKRRIWNGRWGIMPGMSWKHEDPFEEESTDDPAFVPADSVANSSHNVGEAPIRRIFGSPSPVASNHRQTSGILNTSQQGSSADADSASLENGDAERSPSTSNLARPKTGKQILHPTVGKASRPSRKRPSHEDEQPQPVASVLLSPVHSSKVSKAIRKKRPGPQRQLNTEPLPQTASIPPRRSKRLQPPEPSIAQGSTGIISTDSPKSISQPRPKRKVADTRVSTVSAKPQRISKRQRSSTTRGKARKG
ncbi:MAG: hypothetical protein M1840_005626 [Geoglossum simile]|nr:MAG: hypothetical protein M1840_005626 [Geoglossum simile]